MKIQLKNAAILILPIVLVLTACPNPSIGDSSGGYSAGYSVSHTANSVSFAMNYVPSGGPFTMGEDVESTTQEVTLTKSFWMGETEVMQLLWEVVMGTTWPGTDPDGSGSGDGFFHPAYYVNWYDAVEFCNALTIAEEGDDTNCVYYSDDGYTTVYTSGTTVYADFSKTGYRLPTEAEWEYSARWIDGSSWNGGDHVSGGPIYTDESDPDKIGDYAWYFGNNSGSPGDSTYGSKEVGQKNSNALGLYDMSGNVHEWCYDWYGSYSDGSKSDPTGANSGGDRVFRGGYWIYSGLILRCATRNGVTPSNRYDFIGFRLCRTAD